MHVTVTFDEKTRKFDVEVDAPGFAAIGLLEVGKAALIKKWTQEGALGGLAVRKVDYVAP